MTQPRQHREPATRTHTLTARASLRVAIAAVLAASATLSCTAASRMAGATVEQVDGAPCFSLPAAELPPDGTYRLYSMEVHRYESRAGDPVWSFDAAFDGPGIPMATGRCVPYGQVLPAAARARKAEPLVPGTLYLITVGASATDSTVSKQGYRAEFCVVPAPGGSMRVHQVQWDAQARQWRREVCTLR